MSIAKLKRESPCPSSSHTDEAVAVGAQWQKVYIHPFIGRLMALHSVPLRGGAEAKDVPGPEALVRDVSSNLMTVLTDTHELFAQGRVSLDRYARTIERHARVLKALSSSEPASEADAPAWNNPPFGLWRFHDGSPGVREPVLKHLAAARRRFNGHVRPDGGSPPLMGEVVRASQRVTHSALRDVEEQVRQGLVSHKTYLQIRSRLFGSRPGNGWEPEVEVDIVSPSSAFPTAEVAL